MLNDPLHYSQNCMAMCRQIERERERERIRQTGGHDGGYDGHSNRRRDDETDRVRLKELTLGKHCVTTNQCSPLAQETVIMQ